MNQQLNNFCELKKIKESVGNPNKKKVKIIIPETK